MEKSKEKMLTPSSSSHSREKTYNRPSTREGIIDKIEGVRMHVSLSEAVRMFVVEKEGEEF